MKGPLVQFQAAQFSKDEMKRLVKMVNGELTDATLAPDVLENVFEMWWPKLEEQVATELEGDHETEGEGRRPERDLLEEVLALTRGLAGDRERRMEFEHPAWDDLLESVTNLLRVIRLRSPDDETKKAIRSVLKPLEFIARRGFRRGLHGPGRISRRHLLMELEDILEAEVTAKVAETTSSE